MITHKQLNAFSKGRTMKPLRWMAILFFMFPSAIVLAPAPDASGQQPGTMRQYEDPSGLFKITIPAEWKVERVEEATHFLSPDETSILTIIAIPVGPSANTKLSPDDLLKEMSAPFFSGWRNALADQEKYEGLKVHPTKKAEFQGFHCLRQDFNYRRKTSPLPREASAFFFVTENITMFITASGTIDGAKISRSHMDTLNGWKSKGTPQLRFLEVRHGFVVEGRHGEAR